MKEIRKKEAGRERGFCKRSQPEIFNPIHITAWSGNMSRVSRKTQHQRQGSLWHHVFPPHTAASWKKQRQSTLVLLSRRLMPLLVREMGKRSGPRQRNHLTTDSDDPLLAPLFPLPSSRTRTHTRFSVLTLCAIFSGCSLVSVAAVSSGA